MAQESSRTAVVARYARELTYRSLPEKVVAKAKEVILDSVACQLACSELPHGRIAIDFARQRRGPADATVIGTDFKTSAEHAALVNGIFGHGDEIDQSMPLFGHASAVLVSAVLAVGEREKTNGKDLITALVAGYDIAGRLGRSGFKLAALAPHNREGSASAGSIASAVAVGKLLGLSQQQMQAAIGLGAEQASGLQAMRTESGHMNKSVHMGLGSRNGITAADMARVGYGGALTVLEPPYSVFEAFIPDEAKPDELTSELGERFEILDTRFKRYASGSPTHCAIAAMFEIMEDQQLTAADIDTMLIKAPMIEQKLLSGARTLNINYEYAVAVAALDGYVSWDSYTEERQKDPVLLDLWGRIRTEGDPELDLANQPYGARPAEVTLNTRDGRSFTKRMIYPPGHPRNPLSAQEMEAKFMYWATRVISERQASKLRAVVDGLEDVTDVNVVGDLLRVESGAPAPE